MAPPCSPAGKADLLPVQRAMCPGAERGACCRCASLRRHKLDVDQVGRGTECGVLLDNFSEAQPGDVLQCFKTEMVPARQARAASA